MKGDDFRSKTLVKYERNQIKNYGNNLIILRFAGLYETISERNFANYLHRNNAANIIKFFIENEFYSNNTRYLIVLRIEMINRVIFQIEIEEFRFYF
ncbi:MAG: hypothetical protein NT01SARS_0989 [SAR86 cluster bacterium SAR86A]|uniref:Uncharacterized protein n=1 Tax=SAR86 cluster bacterium SAR86A TaxID=1123866 RepID=J5K4K9_9GAMM|nr:MAG: hypothetical protein NT01SARS_0989 [SAR86 cluster bacterium SAR86A]